MDREEPATAYEGRAAVRFSAREDVEPLWQDVRAGIIRSVSVGYAVRAYEVIEQDGQVPVWRAIDWQPVELSAVPVGADGGAGFRSGRTSFLAGSSPGRPPPINRRPQPWINRTRRPRPAPPQTPTHPVQTQEEPVTRDTPKPP